MKEMVEAELLSLSIADNKRIGFGIIAFLLTIIHLNDSLFFNPQMVFAWWVHWLRWIYIYIWHHLLTFAGPDSVQETTASHAARAEESDVLRLSHAAMEVPPVSKSQRQPKLAACPDFARLMVSPVAAGQFAWQRSGQYVGLLGSEKLVPTDDRVSRDMVRQFWSATGP